MENAKRKDVFFGECILGKHNQALLSFTNVRKNSSAVHNVQFVKYNVTVSFMAQVLDTVTYLVPQVLDTAS